MKGKVTAVILTGLLVLGVVGCSGGKRIVTEKLIAQIDLSSWIPESLGVSPDSKRVISSLWSWMERRRASMMA